MAFKYLCINISRRQLLSNCRSRITINIQQQKIFSQKARSVDSSFFLFSFFFLFFFFFPPLLSMADAIERALCNGYRQWLSRSFSVRRTFSFRLVDDTVKRLDLTLPSGSFNARNGRKFETKRDPDRS